MTPPKVTCLIVTYNSQKYIKQCLESLIFCDYKNIEILVIDNCSFDSTPEILERFVKKYKNKIKVFYNKENVGYAEGNNLGIEKSSGQFIFIINPDSYVSKDFLYPLVNKMVSDKSISACQPLVYLASDKKRINLSGKVTNFLGFDWIKDYMEENPTNSKISSFSGSGVLLRRATLNRVGVFDRNYFMYYEDTDLSWRMRLMNYKIVFVPESHIYHDYKFIPEKNYQSIQQKFFYNDRNRLITIIKNYKTRTLLLILPALIFIEISMMVFNLLKGWFTLKFRIYLSIISNFPTIFKDRSFIQKSRHLSDKEIVRNFKYNLHFSYFENPAVKFIINPVLTVYWYIIKRFI